MGKHLKYFNYIIKHKWYVFVYGLKLGVPVWQLIIHDWTKFLPVEWFPYVHYFYGTQQYETYKDVPFHLWGNGFDLKWDVKELVKISFDGAWNHHQKHNPHHWQYWLLKNDSGELVALEMPYKYVLEMLADWCSAGKCINGRVEVMEWYKKTRPHIILHDKTREIVDELVQEIDQGVYVIV